MCANRPALLPQARAYTLVPLSSRFWDFHQNVGLNMMASMAACRVVLPTSTADVNLADTVKLEPNDCPPLHIPAPLAVVMRCIVGCERVPSQILGGMYRCGHTKPAHGVPGATRGFQGIRMLSDAWGKTPGRTVWILGCDDGSTFWSSTAALTIGRDGAPDAISLSFTPPGSSVALDADITSDRNILW